MKYAILATTVCVVVTLTNGASAQTYPTLSIEFGPEDYTGNPTGGMNAVAMNSGETVEEHMGSYETQPPFWSSAGLWGEGFGGASEFDDGAFSQLAGDAYSASLQFVEVHQSTNGMCCSRQSLWYRTGTYSFNPLTVNWQPPAQYQAGFLPSIAEASVGGSDTELVEVHSGETCEQNGVCDFDGSLWAITATSPSQLATNTAQELYPAGTNYQNAHVAIMPNAHNGGFFVIVVYMESPNVNPPGYGNSTSTLGYSTYSLTYGGVLQKKSSGNYDSGALPSVAICSESGGDWLGPGYSSSGDASVVEIHNGGGAGRMWYHTARIDMANDTVYWNPSGAEYAYDDIYYNAPSVACTGTYGLEVHALGSGENPTLRWSNFTLEN